MPFINQWTFTPNIEGLKLTNADFSQIHVLLKRNIVLEPLSSDDLVVYGSGTPSTIKIKRSECIVPAPGVSMEAFLDSLAALIST